ncbi:ABC transporter permease subunit [Companilactobacillus sp.]|uniref:ABC transporter permease n=1 Tax=Companilactobacillus sp. TaxID=2767905 RepID=UPI002603C8D5|nr:ABC transporter permease subunit [Companilactobacillus sp.]
MVTRKKIILLLIPFYLFFFLFFCSALLKSLVTSFGYYPILNMKRFTLHYYLSAVSDSSFMMISLRTFLFSVFSAFLACAIGLMLALIFKNKLADQNGMLTKMIQIPVMLPHIFVILALFQLISQTGVLSGMLTNLGWLKSSNDFPLLLNDPGQIGVLITYLWKEIPFVIVSLMLILRQMNTDFQDVARNLGANKWQIFWQITLPLLQPALINVFIINFSFNFGSYEVPFLLGSQQKELLPVYIYDFYVQGDFTKLPLVMSLNILLSLFSILFAALMLKISRSMPGGHLGGFK